MSFANQVIVITGASGGIGAALSNALADEGCKLGLVARNVERLEKIAEEARGRGAEAVIAVADVGDRQQTVTAIQQVRDQLGPIDLLVASAGLGDPDKIDPFDAELFERLMRVNWVGLVNAVEAVLPEMLQRGQGHLAVISSLRGYKGLPGFAGYSATKAAVNTFMEALRVDLRDRGISVTTICPGFVRTPMTDYKEFPMPWIMEPDDAARRIVHALRRKRSVYNFPWQNNLRMQVARLLPDWLIARIAPR